jgi:iron(III) transport system permease protein
LRGEGASLTHDGGHPTVSLGEAIQRRPAALASRFPLDAKHVGFWALTLTVGVFVAAPLALLVLNSFRRVSTAELGFGLSNLTLANYVAAYTNPTTYELLLNSFGFALGSMVVAILLGGAAAFLAERTDLRFRALIPALVLVPLVMPSVVKGIAWILLLSPQIGLVNQWWHGLFGGPLLSVYSLPAMMWVEGISMSPLAFLLIGATLRQMDPALEDAAAMSGGSPLQVFWRVTLPLLAPALAGVLLLLFIRGMESFEIPMLLGFNAGIFVFSTSIYHALRTTFPPEYGLGFAYSMSLILISVAALYLYHRKLSDSTRFATVTGKNFQPRLVALGQWRYLAWAFLAFYGLCAILLPLFILVWGSLLRFYRAPSAAALGGVSLANYEQILEHPSFLSAVQNTLFLCVVSSVSVMALAVLISWFVYRTDIAARGLLDLVVFIPYALPSIAVGVAFMILFLSFPNPIYNTIWIIILAYTVHYLPIASRFTHAAVVQIHKELEEAAWISGAGFWRTMGRIWLPLLAPALLNGMLFVLVLSFKIMSIAALLQGPDSMVLAVFLWNLWDRGGSTGAAAALSVLMIVVISALTIISRRLVHGGSAARAL